MVGPNWKTSISRKILDIETTEDKVVFKMHVIGITLNASVNS